MEVMTVNLKLKGELISDEWAEVYREFGFYTGYYCPADITRAIDALNQGEELVLEINSIGGMVDAANEIYATLAKCPNPTRAEIQSLAASAASYFPLACDRVEIALPAQMMIHCAAWLVGGDKSAHRWAANQLDVTDQSILEVYCKKCGSKANRTKLQELMEAESYLNARQCLDLGLVDGIIGEVEEPKDEEPVALVASVTNNVIRAMRTLPDIQDLIALRATQRWKATAQLEIEKNRY
jgi:ATP-dependent Clp protease protease subunit